MRASDTFATPCAVSSEQDRLSTILALEVSEARPTWTHPIMRPRAVRTVSWRPLTAQPTKQHVGTTSLLPRPPRRIARGTTPPPLSPLRRMGTFVEPRRGISVTLAVTLWSALVLATLFTVWLAQRA